jgi:hypothetical protein
MYMALTDFHRKATERISEGRKEFKEFKDHQGRKVYRAYKELREIREIRATREIRETKAIKAIKATPGRKDLLDQRARALIPGKAGSLCPAITYQWFLPAAR